MFNTDHDFRAYVDAERAEHLRAVFIVEDAMPYAYTIGNAIHGGPELLLIGSADAGVRDLLHHVSRMIPRDPRSGYMFKPQAKGSTRLKLVDANVAKASEVLHTLRIGEYHLATPFRLMQVLLPDPNGLYPDDPRCAEPYRRVPVIGG